GRRCRWCDGAAGARRPRGPGPVPGWPTSLRARPRLYFGRPFRGEDEGASTTLLDVRAPLALSLVVAFVCGSGCGLSPGERFGRAGAVAGRLRIHVAEDAVDLDPARAHKPIER